MSRSYVVTGAASGIGAATAALLREQGDEVLSVDLRDADVEADLGTPEGRAAAVDAVRAHTDVVHGVVPAAGVAGLTGTDPRLVASVNYFGAVDLVRGLHPQLAAAAPAGGAAVVFLASNSITCQPDWPADLARTFLRGDEDAAREAAAQHEAVQVYPASKAALAWWARREGVTPAWAGAGIRLNSRGAGQDRHADDRPARRRPGPRPARRGLPERARPRRPAGGGRRPRRVPALRAASLLVGACLVVDGGTDAMLHPQSPQPWVTR